MFDKNIEKIRDFNPKNNYFYHDYYFFDNSSDYELRLGKIENCMAIILKKIEEANNSITLTQNEIYFIQLFLFLQGSRQTNTTEVIKEDESEIYQSNNYLFGLYNISSEIEREKTTITLINAIESLMREESNDNLNYWISYQCETLHLNIIRSNEMRFCISDVCVLIENDIDNRFLYAYYPQTPRTAFLLIKSKYFYSIDSINRHFPYYEDPSMIFRSESTKLICQYVKKGISKYAQILHLIDLQESKNNLITLNYLNLLPEKIEEFNKIFLDDGTKFLFIYQEDYIEKLKNINTPYRKIILI